MHQLGLGVPIPVITVRGRRTGTLHSTPVHPYHAAGHRYVVGPIGSDWVKNAVADGEAVLASGRRRERVRLTLVPTHKRGPVLREFPNQAPQGVRMMTQYGGVRGPTPDDFAEAADICAVFRIEPVTE